MNKNLKKWFIGILLFISINSCSQDNPNYFDDKSFYEELSENSTEKKFIKCVKVKKDSSCFEMFPEFYNLGYDSYLTFSDGTKQKLTFMTEPMTKYLASENKDSFLALTIFLYEKGYASRKLYDDMLEINLKIDSTNLIANYELARLRLVEGGYLGLSHFLIDRMYEVYPDNVEIGRIKGEIENEFGTETYNKTMDYKEYLELNPHYVPPNE